MQATKRLLSLLTLALGLPALAATAQAQGRRATTTATPARPRLTVLLVLDQFRADYLPRYSRFFGEGGFKLLMREGAYLTNTHYSHATTYTGPGHALIPSGTFGHTSGIVGNRWYNRASKQIESMFYDADAKILGVDAVPKDDDTSPRNFRGDSLGDQLRLATNNHAKVIGISNKDRAAIMLAGQLGKAYWFHEGVGGMTSSTYYGTELPAWLREFNARKIPDSYFGKSWDRKLPEAEYEETGPDKATAETDMPDLGNVFPHVLTDKSGKPTADYYTAFTATPWATDYQLQLAKLVIEKEELGADATPDLLGISLTATDIAGHAFGPHSQEQQDLIVRTDEYLADFLRYLSRRFKPGEVAIALTADHGAVPVPEQLKAKRIAAGRIRKKTLSDAIEMALSARYGEAKWVLAMEDPAIFLDPAPIAAKGLNPAEVQRAAGDAIIGIEGIAGYFTREQLMHGPLPPNRYATMMEKAFYPERSGDLMVLTRPYYFWGSYGEKDTGTTHGSPYEYDTHVPLLIRAAGVRPGRFFFSTDVADLAPTLSALLGVSPPSGNEGRVLHEILER